MSSLNPRPYPATAPRKLAFIGLGAMGFPMAGHLARAGHRVTVYNRNPAKAQAWVAEFGGSSQPTPRLAAQGAELVLCCVGNDADVRAKWPAMGKPIAPRPMKASLVGAAAA